MGIEATHSDSAIGRSLKAMLLSTAAVALIWGFAEGAARQAYAQGAPAQKAKGQSASYNIAPQSLGSALTNFADRAGLKILFPTPIVAGKTSSGLSGSFSRQQALSRLLAGTGLTYRFTASDTVRIDDPNAVGNTAGATVDGAIALDTIDVTGGNAAIGPGFQGKPDWVYETPGSVSVITRQAIEERPARNTGDIVRDTAGVWTSPDRQNPGFTANIRGMQDQGRVNVAIDGARQDYQQSGHGNTSYAYVDPELMAGVIIDKGPTSGVGGAGVIGGIINFRTLDADDILLPGRDIGMRLNGTTGTNEYHFAGSAVFAAKPTNQFEVVGGISRKRVGEYKPGQKGSINRLVPPEYGGNLPIWGIPLDPVRFSGQEQWSGLFKTTIRPTDDHEFKFSYVGFTSEFQTSTGATTTQYIDENKIKNSTFNAAHRWNPESEAIDLTSKIYYTVTSNASLYPARRTYCPCDIDYEMGTLGGSVANTSRFLIPLFDVALNYGFEFARNKANNSASVQTGSDVTGTWFTGPTPSGERTISSGFLSSTFTHNEWLSLIVGGRFDHYSLNGRGSYANGVDAGLTDFSVDNSEHRFLPKATLAVKPLDGLQVYGTYMEGWRPPTLLETLFHGNHIGQSPTSAFFAPNPSLEAETSKTWELGTNYKKNGLFFSADALRLKAAYFETTAENYIMLAGVGIPFNSGAVPRSLASYVNLTNTTQLKGFEVEANYDAGPAYIGVSYSRLTNNFDDADYNFWANGRGSLIPPVWWTEDAAKTSVFQLFAPPKQKVTVDGGVRLFDRVLTLGARATFVDRGDHAGNQTVFMNTKAYQIYDLYGSYKFGESLTARFSVENLTDVAYVDAMGVVDYPAPGRTFTISLSSRF